MSWHHSRASLPRPRRRLALVVTGTILAGLLPVALAAQPATAASAPATRHEASGTTAPTPSQVAHPKLPELTAEPKAPAKAPRATAKRALSAAAEAAPTVVSADGNYPDTDHGGGVGQQAGTPGKFTLTSNGTTAATKFAFRLDEDPGVDPPASETAAAVNNTATVTVTPRSSGPHTLYVYAVDTAGNYSESALYRFTAAGHPSIACASWAACLDNTAVSPDSTPALGAADGADSYSATDLTKAGWKSGGTVTVNGATFTLPVFGTGQKDNILAGNQVVPFAKSIPAAGTTALTFLAFSTKSAFSAPGGSSSNELSSAPFVPEGTPVAGNYCSDLNDQSCFPSGRITFADGSTQDYDLLTPDWLTGPSSLAAVTLPHENTPTGQVSTAQPKIYAETVPIAAREAGKAIVSVTLPDLSGHPVDASYPELHIMGMATRNTTATTAPVSAGETWTGAWANPTEEQNNFQGSNFSDQTFRIALKPSVSGNAIRVKLDDALGTSPLTIGHATVALASGSPSAVPSGPVTNLTFGGKAGTTIPEGGMVYSDPLPFRVTANQYLLVSFDVTNSVKYLVEHSWSSNGYQYLSAAGSGDHTADTTGTAFSGTGTYQGWYTNLVTDVDVATQGESTQAVLGDNLIDAWQPGTSPNGTTAVRLADDLATAEPSTPAPTGTVAEGIESNEILTDYPQTHNGGGVGGPSALSRIDRDILDQPGLTTVVLDEGLDDVLNGTDYNTLTNQGYSSVLNYLTQWGINVIVVGLPPCEGYTGDKTTGTSTNDPCSATADNARLDTNNWLSENFPTGPGTTPTFYYVDPDATIGVHDTTTGEIKLSAKASTSDKVNLSNAGYAALANADLAAQNTWLLNDGTTGDTTTPAADTASNENNAYLANDAQTGTETAALSPTGAAWASDSSRGNILTLDGVSGTASAATPALDTSGSYSVAAWVDLSRTTANATVISQQGTAADGFALEYSKSKKSWAFVTTRSDAATATQYLAAGTTAPKLNAWTQLVGTYNATTHLLSLYVNGVLAGIATDPTPWNATGTLHLGSSAGTSAFFPGKLSDVQAWNYELSPTQVTVLFQQIS